MASPDPKRQQQEQQQQVPPEYKPFEEEWPKQRKGIDWSNRQAVENWLNNLKPGFENYLLEKHQEAISSNLDFTRHLYSYLTMYQGEIVGEYLSEGAMEMLFSALGPIGNLWRSAYSKNISWKMAWMKNPLNPNALYYYFNALPNQKAFEVTMLPIKGVMAIMAKGGGPFTETTYTDYNGKVRKEYLFTPLVQATKVAHSLADGLDKLSDFSTNTFNRDHSTWDSDDSKWKQDITQVHLGLKSALEKLATAKKSNDKQGVSRAYGEVDKFLNKYNGSVFRKLLGNTARRLRSTERDPISYLLALIGGAIWDLTLGIALNTVKLLATKAINIIPGVRVLRAQFTEFITGDKFLSNASIGGSSIRSVVQGIFTPATASFGYTGYRALSSLFPNASVSQLMNPFTGEIFAFTVNPAGLIGGAATLSTGIFYNVALKMAASNNYYWTSQYQTYLNASTFKGGWAMDEGALGNKLIKENYFKGFKPGPISNFAKYLAEHPFVRIPINGLAIGDLLSPLMQQYYGWNPWFTRGVFTGVDYLLQTRQAWGRLISNKILTPLGKYILKIPVVQSLVTQFQFGISFPLKNWWSNMVYKATSFQDSLIGKTAVSWEVRPWAKFAKNFFNPGFFMGFGLVPILSPSIGGWAYIVGPVAGSIGWNLGAFALEKTFGVGAASMSRINAVGWTGYLIGSLLDLVIPGSQVWLGPLLSGGFIAADIFLALAGKSLIGLIAQGLSSIVGIFSSTAAAAITASSAIAAWATITSIAAVAGLTVFFAYTIYAGFWVPMIEEGKAGPESSNFQISNNCTQTGPNQYNCCSNFSVTENIFNTMHFLEHKTDIHDTYLSIDLTDPTKTTSASRNSAKLDYSDVGTTLQLDLLTPQQYAINYDPADPIIEGQQLANPVMLAYLSTPDKIRQNLKNLMATNQSVVYSMKPFWDMLVTLAEEHDGTEHLVAEYNAQIDLLEEQQRLVDDLIDDIKKKDLEAARITANDYLDNEPMGGNPCPEGNDCPEEKQNLKDLYDSWEPTVRRYINKIELYQKQADLPLDQFLTDLNNEFDLLEEQIKILEQIRDMAQDAQGKMDDKDAARILELEEQGKFLNYSNLTTAEQDELWNLLAKYFSEVFTNSNFYFVPQGTHYQVCMDMTYTGTLPADPQTVCSTISYQPSIWGPNTAFAKSCTTFTPQ